MGEITSQMLNEIEPFFIITASIMMLVGSFACLVAALGLIRFPDFFTRTHAAAIAGPLGAGIILVAVGISSQDYTIISHSLLGFLFLILTAPVGAHLLARAAYLIKQSEKKDENKSDKNMDLNE